MFEDCGFGDNLDEWRYPICTFGSYESQLRGRICRHEKLGGIKIDTDEWDEHCDTVDNVLNELLEGLKKYSKEFEGLIIHHFVKQGSSRDGLKVSDAIEFDCLLIFEIEGMVFQKCSVFNNDGCEIPELIKLRVDDYDNKYSWLKRSKIFDWNENDGEYYINTRNLHDKIFKALLDRTRASINYKVTIDRSKYSFGFMVNSPTLPSQITVYKDKIDMNTNYSDVNFKNVDHVPNETTRSNRPIVNISLVPALMLRQDYIPDPFTTQHISGDEMSCPIFAVLQWAHHPEECNISVDPAEIIWRESSCAYEKLIFDIARRSQSQRYLMTSCRVVTSYVTWLKINRPDSHLQRVVTPYYLKNICLHCIALLTIRSNNNTLSGVKEALGYFLQFLELCIKNKNLPHFFYGNPWVSKIFPKCSFKNDKISKNLYSGVKSDIFGRAERDLSEMLRDLEGLYTDSIYLEDKRIEPFEELLGNRYGMRKPDKVISEGFKICFFFAFISILMSVIFAYFDKYLHRYFID